MKIKKFFGKGKTVNIFLRVWKFFENRGEMWNRGENASWSQRGDGRLCKSSPQ